MAKIHVNRMDIEDSKLIFMHVPKTGGTTLHSIFAKNFSAGEVCPERFDNLDGYSAGELAKYRYFSGHYSFNSCHLIPGLNKKIVTFLRRPKDRLISMYYFFRSHKIEYANAQNLRLPILANENGFCDFLVNSEIQNGRVAFNPYIQLLTGRRPSLKVHEFEAFFRGDRVLSQHDTDLVDLALSRLSEFFAFGVLEKYEDSVRHILDRLDIEVPKVIGKERSFEQLANTSGHYKRVEKEGLTEEHEILMLGNTYLDQIFYEKALALFSRRIENMIGVMD